MLNVTVHYLKKYSTTAWVYRVSITNGKQKILLTRKEEVWKMVAEESSAIGDGG